MYYGRTQNSTLFSLLTVDGVRFQSFSFQPATAGSPLFPAVFSAISSGNFRAPRRRDRVIRFHEPSHLSGAALD